jgi:pimeloyl-ACP methyl ester carboxylesterase
MLDRSFETSPMGPEKWLDVDGVRTRYFDRGRGPCVVFVHGGNIGHPSLPQTAHAWEPNFPGIAETFRAVSLDRIGQGGTAAPLDDDGYTMQGAVKHAATFLRLLGKGPYHLVGHSRGGLVVTRVALEYPELVASATIVACGTLTPGAGRAALAGAHAPSPRLGRAAIRYVLERGSFDPNCVTDRWVDELVESARSDTYKETLGAMMTRRLFSKRFMPELGRLRSETHHVLLARGMPCPTLLVWAADDPTGDIDGSMLLDEMFMRRQRQTEVRYFNRAGHYLFREHPTAFNRMLAAFVRQHAAG